MVCARRELDYLVESLRLGLRSALVGFPPFRVRGMTC